MRCWSCLHPRFWPNDKGIDKEHPQNGLLQNYAEDTGRLRRRSNRASVWKCVKCALFGSSASLHFHLSLSSFNDPIIRWPDRTATHISDTTEWLLHFLGEKANRQRR